VKIGLVSPYDYSFPGGVVQHISHLANYYNQWGHTVKIIAPVAKEDARYFDEDVKAVGHPFPIPYGGSIARIPISPWLPVQVRKVLKEEKFDVLHLHEPFTPMLCMSALIQSSAVNIGTFHAYHSKSRAYKTLKPLFYKLKTRLDGKIVVSDPLYSFLNRYAPDDYQVIPNGIDTERFSSEGKTRPEFEDGKLNILFVGRLEKRKGLGHLIDACALVKKEFDNFRLIVVGPGRRLRHKYINQIEELKLDNVVFTNFVPFNELPEYYRTADIYCSPATGGESFGIVLLEAMACGKPVVASNIEGYASVLRDTIDGLLSPPGDAQSLAQTLLKLLDDAALRKKMGDRGKENAQNYSWPKVARRVLNLYERVSH
jgi:phosphatidyl-myo-inositol alpha-mannosyltransferase